MIWFWRLALRKHSRDQWPRPDPDSTAHKQSTRPDIQAALTVIGRRDTKYDVRPIDLARARLAGADLGGAGLSHARLGGADLVGAYLDGANLDHATLGDANLANVRFFDATPD